MSVRITEQMRKTIDSMGDPSELRHVVMYSGGVGSYSAAKRVIEQYGSDSVTLLFCDTLIEDEDLYRFLHESAVKLDANLKILRDGRDPFQVFKDVGFMGNTRVDPCSLYLKRELADRWMGKNFNPCNTICYAGFDWTEAHRYKNIRENKRPWIYRAPMCEPPYIHKSQMLDEMRSDGIEPPRLYDMGFPHNNCGGFCVKAGQAHFKLLYEQLPERYLDMERRESEVYKHIGKRHPFLRKKIDGKLTYLTLREYREQYLDAKSKDIDVYDYGGCGCFGESE